MNFTLKTNIFNKILAACIEKYTVAVQLLLEKLTASKDKKKR